MHSKMNALLKMTTWTWIQLSICWDTLRVYSKYVLFLISEVTKNKHNKIRKIKHFVGFHPSAKHFSPFSDTKTVSQSMLDTPQK